MAFETLQDSVRGDGATTSTYNDLQKEAIRGLWRRTNEIRDTLNLSALPTIPEVLRTDFGDIEMRQILDGDKPGFEHDQEEIERIEAAIAGKTPEDLNVVEPGVMMSLSALRRSGRCSDAEFSLMSIESPQRQREFVEYRANVPAGAVQAPSASYSRQLANWALGGKKPA